MSINLTGPHPIEEIVWGILWHERKRRDKAARRIQTWWMDIYLDPRHPVGLKKIERDYVHYLCGSVK